VGQEAGDKVMFFAIQLYLCEHESGSHVNVLMGMFLCRSRRNFKYCLHAFVA
jgi:hypothetical protein